MKFLIVGLGSMGKRRIRNLKYLKAGEIIGFDTMEARRKEAEEKYGIKTFDDFDKAKKEQPDAFIISTPPDLHVKYAMEAAKHNKHFFMEASVVDEGMDELIALVSKQEDSCRALLHDAFSGFNKEIEGARGQQSHRQSAAFHASFWTIPSGLAPMGRLPEILRCQTRNWRGEGDSVFRVGLVGVGFRKH